MIQKQTAVYASRGHTSSEECSNILGEKNFQPSGEIMKTKIFSRTIKK